MAVSVFAAAKRMCEISGWNVTNLQLQKILYLAHMMYLGRTNNRLISSNFEAWDYGPVVPELYHEVKKYGSKPIRTGFYGIPSIVGTCENAELEAAAKYLLSKRPSRLVDFTHRKGGAWDKNYTPGVKGLIIPDEDIISEYGDLNAV